MRFAVAVIAFAVLPAFAQGIGTRICPAERPIARKVIDYSVPIQCTLMACIGELVCPKDEDQPCVRLPTNNCNHCTEPATVIQCFSADEMIKVK
jgi:hypothetical protein